MPFSFQELAQIREYPGRFIILGNQDDEMLAVYGVTGRNPSSRARRYVMAPDKKSIYVEATDPDVMAQGNLDLLDYTAFRFFKNGLVVANGRQIDLITQLDQQNAKNQLERDLPSIEYEPDKYSTPRITGCILNAQGIWTQALHRVCEGDKRESVRETFPIRTNETKYIATYAGPNIRPTPSFIQDPIEIDHLAGNTQEIARCVYDALVPVAGKEDLRVSVMAVKLNTKNEIEYSIINSADNN